jgi:hypothetical protein
LAREGVDSPQETRLRLLLVLGGLPEPRVNLIIRGRDGSWRRRYDLAYEHLRLIIEYDGRKHAEDSRQWLTDIFRREELDQMRWRLVIVTSEASIKSFCGRSNGYEMRCSSAEPPESGGPSTKSGGCCIFHQDKAAPWLTRAVSRWLASIKSTTQTLARRLETAEVS